MMMSGEHYIQMSMMNLMKKMKLINLKKYILDIFGMNKNIHKGI